MWLRKAGDRTIHVGKYLNDYGTEDPREVPPGWDEWHGLTDPGTYQMWGNQMNDNGTLTTHGSFEVEDPATYQTDVLARKAVEQIDAAASGTEPFFMTLWFLAPHREVASLSNQLAPRPAPRHAGAFAT